MPADVDKVFLPQNTQGLHWSQRSEEIQQKIERAYSSVSCFYPEELWGSCGSEEYSLCKISDHLMIEKKLLEGISQGKKDFILMDIGVGNFQWGDSAFHFIHENPLFKDKNITVQIFSLRGERTMEDLIRQQGFCTHYRYGNFKIENLQEELSRLGHNLVDNVDLIVSSWSLRYLVDPVGTFIQAYGLLVPKKGLIFFDGFLFKILNGSFSILDNLLTLLASFKSVFFMHETQLGSTINAFVMQKNSSEIYIPLEYRVAERSEAYDRIKSRHITSFQSFPECVHLNFYNDDHFEMKEVDNDAYFFPKNQSDDFMNQIKFDHSLVIEEKYKKAVELFIFSPDSMGRKNLKDVKNILKNLLLLSPEKSLKLIDIFLRFEPKKALAVFNFHDKDEKPFSNFLDFSVSEHGGEVPLLQFYYTQITTYGKKRCADLLKKLIEVSSLEVIHLSYGSREKTLLKAAKQASDKIVIQQLMNLETAHETIKDLFFLEKPAIQFRKCSQSVIESDDSCFSHARQGMQTSEVFNLMRQTENPKPSKDTDAIWILSARHNIHQSHVNCSTHAVNFQSVASVQCDPEDDYLRIKAGLEFGAQLTAERARKTTENLSAEDYELYAPVIIYNGLPEQNSSFEKAIREGLRKLSLPDYPSAKIVIIPLAEDKMHTGGQFDSLAEQVKLDLKLRGLESDTANILCISSAFHLPRIQRLFNSKTFSCPFSPLAKITLWGIDREFKRPCASEDVEGELKRIPTYLKKGDIGEPRSADWYSVSSLKYWTPLRYMREAGGLKNDEKSEMTHSLKRRYSLS